MDFDWTEEQRLFREAIIRFAERELADDVVRRDADGAFSRTAWQKCADLGIQGLPIPKEYGGQGADATTVVAAMEALGYGCKDNGLLFSISAHIWSCEMAIVKFGTEAQRRRYLPGLCDGSLIGVQGMTEPGSGSDAFSLKTTADKKGGGYVLHGSKTFITNAPVADLFVIFASTDPKKRFAGLSAFLVERSAPGLVIGRPLEKMGLRTSPMAELAFDGCEVPEEALLGKPGAGMAIFNESIEWERGFILATAVGTLERQLERCVRYARERKQFGEPIGKFQAVAHRIADMQVRLQSTRLMLYWMAWLRDRGKRVQLESAMTKLALSETFVQSSLDALQIHGGYGYMREFEVERDVRDALAGRIYSGTSDIQRNIIARCLGL